MGKDKDTVILGIDPGLSATGFGCITFSSDKIGLLDYGLIKTSSATSVSSQLYLLFRQIRCLLNLYQPDHIAIEQLFFGSNSSTALKVSQARGVILLACSFLNYEPAEYTPLEVKMALTGYGRADKQQIQAMVKNILGLSQTPQPDDAADALALAICHAHSLAFKTAVATLS